MEQGGGYLAITAAKAAQALDSSGDLAAQDALVCFQLLSLLARRSATLRLGSSHCPRARLSMSCSSSESGNFSDRRDGSMGTLHAAASALQATSLNSHVPGRYTAPG